MLWFSYRLLAFKIADYFIPMLYWSPIGIKMKGMIESRPMIDAYDQSRYFDVFRCEETHVDGVELSIVYVLQVRWKENEVLFQTKFNVEQKKRVLGFTMVVLFVDL